MSLTINAETALRGLEMAVERRGEGFVYQRRIGGGGTGPYGCLNWHGNAETGEPGCVVGMAFHLLGVPAEVLARHPTGAAVDLITDLQTEGFVDGFSPLGITILARAQSSQDAGRSWGTALTRARATCDAAAVSDDIQKDLDEVSETIGVTDE